MKVTIVNDCAHVGWTIKEELEKRGIEVIYLPRSRSLWGKLITPMLNSWRASHRSIIHCNYALQDAWWLAKMGKLDVLHCHGSDVRHPFNREILDYICKEATAILVATEDLINFGVSGHYIPTPIDFEIFKNLASNEGKLVWGRYGISYDNMPYFLNNFSEFYDNDRVPYLSKMALEAMACGLQVYKYGNLVEGYPLENHDVRKVTDKLLKVYDLVDELK
jgi:hypothetical protein